MLIGASLFPVLVYLCDFICAHQNKQIVIDTFARNDNNRVGHYLYDYLIQVRGKQPANFYYQIYIPSYFVRLLCRVRQ